MHLLARKEWFGHLFMDRETEALFSVNATLDTSSLKPRMLEVPGPDGTLRRPDRLTVRDTVPKRPDVLVGPITVEFYPTSVCNERCQGFCYFGDRLNSSGSQFPEHKIPLLIQNLLRAGVFQLTILGGEPFLYRHLTALLDEAGTHEFVISLSTNGTVDRPDVLERIQAWGVHLNISLHSHLPGIHDAMVARKGAFRRTVSTIQSLSSAGRAPHISIVLTRSNHFAIGETIDFLGDLGVRAISLLHTQKTGYARQDSDELLDFRSYSQAVAAAAVRARAHDIHIQVTTNYPFLLTQDLRFTYGTGLESVLYGHPDGRRTVYILSDGAVIGTMYQNLKHPAVAGNSLTDDLGAIWATSQAFEELRSMKPPADCFACEHLDHCRGGSPENWRLGPSEGLPKCPKFDPFLKAE